MEGIHDFERIEDIRLVHILFIHKKNVQRGKNIFDGGDVSSIVVHRHILMMIVA